MQKVKTFPVNQLIDKRGKRFVFEDHDIAIFRVDSEIFAISNICPHKLSAILFDGFIEDENIVCPAHGWEFSLRTGICPGTERKLQTYKTTVIEGFVFIEIPPPKEKKWGLF
ncbi:MAG: Rieske (2Fe-2S) protein [Ignavibacteriales bacterium]|nr:Rieske (2Fe-2S) protein [Ignavibacteriales bacterium]MCF8306634.1 Rieske (2Fe-2S) protein [Ignavibacteriales bacterium]MCF8316266.1 Rieske (2Fe-2S) protein [Ignavibacteriales bacterium]MCF8437850.1 Rieske (2Fe-2S) protein [Ignavibacteriales bacterium]